MTGRASAAQPVIAIVGNLNSDLLLGPLAKLPTFGHEAFVTGRSLRAAGQAFTTALALATLGAPPQLVGAVGDDVFGAQIISELRGAGIDVGGVHTCAGLPTGLSVALLDEQGDRAFVTHPGHLEALDALAVLAHWERVAGCRLLLLCGYFCLPGLRPHGGVALLRRAQDAGLRTVLDTGWDPGDWATGARGEVRALLRHTTIFLPNREEACALSRQDEPEDAAAELATWGPDTVIVKLGADGALGWRGGEIVHVPARPTVVADTVGAGDCFNAGALYALANDWPLDGALRLGTAVAGYAIAGQDPRYPTLERAQALMAAPSPAGRGGSP